MILYNEDLLAITENKALSTEEEGWNMVESDLSYAAKTLPAKWDNEAGRITSGAAYACCRVRCSMPNAGVGQNRG